MCRGKPKIVDLTSERRVAERVTEAYVACGEAQRDEVLYCLLTKHPGGDGGMLVSCRRSGPVKTVCVGARGSPCEFESATPYLPPKKCGPVGPCHPCPCKTCCPAVRERSSWQPNSPGALTPLFPPQAAPLSL